MHVKPNKGATVLDPATGHSLPAAGADVRDTPYWRRMEKRGAVTAARSEDEQATLAAGAAPRDRPKRARKPLNVAAGGKLAGSLTVGKKKAKG